MASFLTRLFYRARIPILVCVSIFLSSLWTALAFATGGSYRDGHTQYARVDRPDRSFRNMFVDNAALESLRSGRRPAAMTILMESYSNDRLSSVFVKQLKGINWSYGSIRPGESLTSLRPGPECSSCHVAASEQDGMFTEGLLKAFVRTSTLQQVRCEKPGRSPCNLGIYRSDRMQ